MIKLMKFLLLSLSVMPFIVYKMAFFPYVTGQNFFAKGIIFTVSILFIINFFFSKQFKNKITEKIKLIIRNPLVVSISIFVFIYIVSTIFAVNKYNAFWGTIERAEGLVGVMFFFAVFLYSFFLFERKDWFLFFKLNLIGSFIILIKEFFQFFEGVARPSSFFDNPTFLAGYLLFSLFCTTATFTNEKNRFWKYFSMLIFVLSILGIFITGTRGTIIGIFFGIISILILFILKGKYLSSSKINLKKTSIIILCGIFIFSGIFISIRKNTIWQKVPGLSRLALIDSNDATTQTRLLTSKLSIDSINPIENGIKKLLIGWGPENFNLAYGMYFNPKQFNYEMKWFDRSHNKLLDVMVMNGLLGLTAYLSIYIFLFKLILKKKDFSFIDTAIIFFGISLLFHLLFVFDQITTSIPLFMVLAFSLFLNTNENKSIQIDIKNKQNFINSFLEKDISIIGIFFFLFTIFLSYVFLRSDLISVIQMRKYMILRENSNTEEILRNINGVFTPFTLAQMNIRDDFLRISEKNFDINNKSMVQLSDIAIYRAEEYSKRVPFDVRFLAYIASAYSNKGNFLKDQSLLDKGEFYFREMINLAPNRPDSNYGLALNLFFQKKYNESFIYYEKALSLNSSYFSQVKDSFDEVYSNFFQYFYNTNNIENFIKTAKRLKENNYIDENMLNQISNYIEKNNKLPYINFTS